MEDPKAPAGEEELLLDIDVQVDGPEMFDDDALMDIDDDQPTVPAANASETTEQRNSESDLRPGAILLNGVDHMSTKDVKLYASAYYPDEEPTVEWVDDSSVVLVFGSEEIGQAALNAFTSEAEFYDGEPNASTLRTAKVHPTNGKYALKVRPALETDRKKKNAKELSRYYLLYGDPREEERGYRRRDGESRQKGAYMDLLEFDRERRRRDEGRGEDDRRSRRGSTEEKRDEPFVDDFPSVLKNNYEPLSKQFGTDRYSRDREYDSSRRRDRHSSEYRSSRRRSLSPGRRREYRDRSRERSDFRDSGRDRDRPSELDLQTRLSSALGSTSAKQAGSSSASRDLSSRIGSNPVEESSDSGRLLSERLGTNSESKGNGDADFGSRLSLKPEDKKSARSRRRAHHLEFD